MATARFTFTLGSASAILVTVAPEVAVTADLQVTIVLLARDGGANVTLASDVLVKVGRTTRVSFNLSLVARWEKALTNATAVLSGAVGSGARSEIASSYCRCVFPYSFP